MTNTRTTTAVRVGKRGQFTLPSINNLIQLDYGGKLLNAVVDFVEENIITVCLTAALNKGETCFWVGERGKRHPATVDDVATDWGMTTAKLRIDPDRA